MNKTVHFVLAGVFCALTRGDVERSLMGVHPEQTATPAVKVDGIWFPVSQALAAATGVDRRGFRAREARRHLMQLGFEVRSPQRAP